MSCISLGWFENLLIATILIAAAVAILRIIVPWLLSLVGWDASGRVMQVLNIICGAVVLIFIVVIVFQLLSCALGGGAVVRFR